MFWDKMQADRIENQSIANLCVNTIWGSGAGYIKTIQKVVGVNPDGIVGPITLKAINENPHPDYLFKRLWERRKKFFEDIVTRDVTAYERKLGRKATERELLKYTKKRFLKGWLNRLNDFQFEE
jgi:lysozyme family protein